MVNDSDRERDDMKKWGRQRMEGERNKESLNEAAKEVYQRTNKHETEVGAQMLYIQTGAENKYDMKSKLAYEECITTPEHRKLRFGYRIAGFPQDKHLMYKS